jgi:hypothetical protein
MGVCDDKGTGYVQETGGVIVPCASWACVNLSDPDVLLEYKAALSSVSPGAVVDHHVPHWTLNDEAALSEWGLRSQVDVPGWFEGELFDVVGGHIMPNGHSVRGILQELGYPSNPRLYDYYPWLMQSQEDYTDSDCWDKYLEVRLPLVGASTPAPPPPSAGDGGARGDGLVPPGGRQPRRSAMSQGQAIGYGLAAAFVASTVVLLYRGRAWD